MSGIINNQSNICQGIEQEPVAFRLKLGTGTYLYQESYFGGAIPLYTQPMRELSDEEILDLCPPNHSDMMNEAYTIEFARAILKKAREK